MRMIREAKPGRVACTWCRSVLEWRTVGDWTISWCPRCDRLAGEAGAARPPDTPLAGT